MSPAGQSWSVRPYSFTDARRLGVELGLSPITAAVLVRRGLGDVESARRFLDASEAHSPFEFHGMREAVELLGQHVSEGGPVAIHGDYDVDGVCSTALAVRALRRLDVDVRPRLPSRMEDGYGLSMRTVEQLAQQGARLLVTVDCGIGAVEEVAHAQRLGMDVIVTDHHRPGAELPGCPVVHPSVGAYPCPDLCATGVAYKLFAALHQELGKDPAELDSELDIVALATVADVVPLLGENRTLVRKGMLALAGTARPGMRALMRVAGVEPQAVSERTLAFALAPRINAAGRLYRADAGLELLLTDDPDRALEIARELDAVNTERQAVETRILFEAEGQLSGQEDRRDDPLHVLAGEDWHPGVIGIVASRLVERYHRPCVLVSLDGDGTGRGSGRSIGSFDLHAGLSACARHLTRFGGHRMAAGLELEAERLPDFRRELTDHARSALRPEDLVRAEHVDAVVPGDAVALELAEELELLRPFGMGNPGINLLLPATRVGDVRPMGEGRHARFTARSAGMATQVVAFGVGSGLSAVRSQPAEARHDLVARLEANEWRGAVEPRLVLRSLHALDEEPDPAPSEQEAGCAGCACRSRGESWWDALWQELDGSLGRTPDAPGARRLVLDVRGRGVMGTLGDLLSTGDSVAVLTADCSRRRRLVEHELKGERFGRGPAAVVSEHCRPGAIETVAAGGREAYALIDYAVIAREPAALLGFEHLFALDPPPFQHTDVVVRGSAGSESAFLHLGWGQAETEFCRQAIEQQYGLRGPLAAVYRALAALPDGARDAELEALLAGEGRHPRPPALAGRCLRVLAEVGLIELERSGATVKCQVVKKDGRAAESESGRVELERSEAFRAYALLHREALEFLGRQAQPEATARAA